MWSIFVWTYFVVVNNCPNIDGKFEAEPFIQHIQPIIYQQFVVINYYVRNYAHIAEQTSELVESFK